MQKQEYKNVYPQCGKDIQEQQIIDALQPKKFWRFDSEIKTIKNILEVA